MQASRSRTWPPRSEHGALSFASSSRRLRPVRRPRTRDVPAGERSDRGPSGAPHRGPRSDRDGGAVTHDRIREDEMAIVPFLEMQVAEGFNPSAIERLLRVAGDSTRRIAEEEAAWWTTEVIERGIAEGKGPEEIGSPDLTDRISPLAEQTLLAMYHAHQARNWTANIVEGFEGLMSKAASAAVSSGSRRSASWTHRIHATDAGTRRRSGRRARDDGRRGWCSAARCSTAEARQVARRRRDVLLRRPRPRCARRPGDGGGLAAAGLPPAHVGLHAGPVLFQEGDYYGQTVNLARASPTTRDRARCSSRRRSRMPRGEEAIAFADIGPVELKGVSGAVHLLRAHRG